MEPIARCLGLAVLVGALCAGVVFAAPERPLPPDPPPAPEAPWLGVFLGEALDGGVQVIAVLPSSPAARGGVRRGDLLVAVDGRAASDRGSADRLLRRLSPGDEVTLEVLRDGTTRTLALRTGSALDAPLLVPGTLLETRGRGFAPDVSRFDRGTDVVQGATLAEIPPELRGFWGAPEDTGILVSRVAAETPAANAGLRVGDLVLQVDGQEVRTAIDVRIAIVRAASEDRPAVLGVLRDRRPVEVRMTVSPGYDAARIVEVGADEADVERLEIEVRAMRRRLEALEREIERLRTRR